MLPQTRVRSPRPRGRQLAQPRTESGLRRLSAGKRIDRSASPSARVTPDTARCGGRPSGADRAILAGFLEQRLSVRTGRLVEPPRPSRARLGRRENHRRACLHSNRLRKMDLSELSWPAPSRRSPSSAPPLPAPKHRAAPAAADGDSSTRTGPCPTRGSQPCGEPCP